MFCVYDDRNWTLANEGDQYLDFECYAVDEDPGPYILLVLSFDKFARTSWVFVEQGDYNGSWNHGTTNQTLDLTLEEGFDYLVHPSPDRAILQRMGIAIPELQ